MRAFVAWISWKNKVELLNIELYASVVIHFLSPIAKHTCLSQLKKTAVKILKQLCFMCHNEFDDSHKQVILDHCCTISLLTSLELERYMNGF